MVPGQEGLVENQQRFRQANERLYGAISAMTGRDAPVPFLCECADDSCVAPTYLTLTEYTGVRSDDSRFIIVPGHATVDSERAVTEKRAFRRRREARRLRPGSS
jgi:hypothetical protein